MSTMLVGESSVTELLETKQHARIRAIDERLHGVLGVAAIDLTSGRVLAYNADVLFPTASSIKIAIMIEMFREERAGRFRFSDQRTVRPEDYAGGSSGPLAERLKAGAVTTTIENLMEDMIVYSDNTATNQCIDLLGMVKVNALLDQFGLMKTRLRRKMMDSAAAAQGRDNVSTPMELARLVELIYRNRAADADSCRRMLDVMKRVKANMRPVIPVEIEVASKPGDLDGVRCEAGLVLLPKRPFVLNVMSTYLDEKENPVPEVTFSVFEYYRKLARSSGFSAPPHSNSCKECLR